MTTITRQTRPEELPEFLSVDDVADWLGASPSTIYSMAARGDLRVIRVGRLLRVPRAALLALAKGRV